jgi:hypothetical protein
MSGFWNWNRLDHQRFSKLFDHSRLHSGWNGGWITARHGKYSSKECKNSITLVAKLRTSKLTGDEENLEHTCAIQCQHPGFCHFCRIYLQELMK